MPTVVPVVLAVVLVGLIVVAMRRVEVGRRRAAEEQRRALGARPDAPADLPPLPPLPTRVDLDNPLPWGAEPGATPPADDAALGSREPMARRASPLPELLAGVVFGDDVSPLTHGMSPADLETRLVLVSTRQPSTIVTELTTELERAGFSVGWLDEHHGAASRGDGSMLIELVPPLPAELGDAERRRKPGPRRPAHPTAPDDATVLVLESVPPVG